SDIAYGLISRFLPCGGTSRPTSVAAEDSLLMPRPPYEAGTPERYDRSFFQRTFRCMLKPQVCRPLALYRSDLKGMTISTLQPSSVRALLTSHTVFQSGLLVRSSLTS